MAKNKTPGWLKAIYAILGTLATMSLGYGLFLLLRNKLGNEPITWFIFGGIMLLLLAITGGIRFRKVIGKGFKSVFK